MKINKYHPDGLCEHDRKLFDEAFRMSKDCNRWQDVKWLSSMAQDPLLESVLEETCRQMFHLREYYDDMNVE